MPLDRYRCGTCGRGFERLRSQSSVAVVVACPDCGSEDVEQSFGLPSKPLPEAAAPTNCAGDGPPCALPMCGRRRMMG